MIGIGTYAVWRIQCTLIYVLYVIEIIYTHTMHSGARMSAAVDSGHAVDDGMNILHNTYPGHIALDV